MSSRLAIAFALATTLASAARAETTAHVPPPPWVEKRVEEARLRLQGTPAGQIVLSGIETHGGLERWFSNGPIAFRFSYRPESERPPIDTRQWVDTWSARARHLTLEDSPVAFGWDGSNAWIYPPEASLPTNARFWSLTPYYFIAMPFVLADPGVILNLEAEGVIEGRKVDWVRVTYAPDTGDAPDDYYVVAFDGETRHVKGLRYVVSYKGFFPDGGHSPEKWMAYDGAQTVEGVTLAETFRTYTWKEDTPGELVTRATLSEVSFSCDLPPDYFGIPPGSKTLGGY